MILGDAVAALLWTVVTVYALTGGADFGGGVWDLLAGGARRGAVPRAVINASVEPVWEANHVWLVITLVLLWTGFPEAFGAIMSTLFIPLSVAGFGIVLRGSGFAFRQPVRSLRYQRAFGAMFASSSLVTPFFFGAAAGAVVTGRVPASGNGDRITSWTTPTAVTLGALSVAAFAYLAAVYLATDASRRAPAMEGYFSRRALVSGVVVGALAGLSLYELEQSAPRIASRLTTGDGLPFVVVSFVLGAAVLVCLVVHRTWIVRYLSAGAFMAMLWGWAVAQYPLLLPGSLTLRAAAAPSTSLIAELVVVGVIVVLVVPSFVLLYRLAQRDLLGDTGAGLLASLRSGAPDRAGPGPPVSTR